MSKVIMTAQEFVNRAKSIASRRTYYKNKWPYNLCYIHEDGRTSADCLNLYKAILNGYDVNNTKVGYFQRDLSNTGDCTEFGLLSQCSDISNNFNKLKEGEPRILYMRGHIGAYIGTVTNGVNTYNVIECTTLWGGGVIYSWVDSDGTRRKCKGGQVSRKWESNGKMTKWVSYESDPKKKTNEETVSIEGTALQMPVTITGQYRTLSTKFLNDIINKKQTKIFQYPYV